MKYVDNDKYGKDVGKLAMIARKIPDAQKLIVSSAGFSLPVKERAAATDITTLTYAELFQRFEKFDAYLSHFLTGKTQVGNELISLSQVYEEPFFQDAIGKDEATAFLTQWRDKRDKTNGWIVVTGEYGTGKTALTKVLQYRRLKDYQQDPTKPIPFRIELRDFSRQFDAAGLLHRFLDQNQLGDVPIDFVFSLIRSGRIVLLLDGYDEMAQYLNARERRACLEALADLSTEGARGILTSRPNYFTETEEFQVFEILYESLKTAGYFLGREAKQLLEREARVDEMLQQFIDRYERALKDLTPEQTESLISKLLADDEQGKAIVLRILQHTFRPLETGDKVSLSGKPVIVSYLLQVVEQLKTAPNTAANKIESLSEWQIYKMIIDQLMIRDMARAPEMNPEDRRRFLRRLALFLSKKDSPLIKEDEFKDLIRSGVSAISSTSTERLPTRAA